MAMFIANDSLSKLASEFVPPTEIMALRGAMSAVLLGGYVAMTVPSATWHLILQQRVLMRAGVEATLAVLFLMSLPHLPLADISAIQQATPLVLTVLSAVVLKEAVGWRRWLAVLAGFVGVLLVIQPGGQGFNIYAVSALGCAVLVAVRDIITRGIDPAVPTLLVTFATTVSVMVAGLVGSPLEHWVAPSAYVPALFAGAAVLLNVANVFVIQAFRGTEVSVVSPFRYSGILWAVLFGYLIWGTVPNNLAILGTAIVIASGLYIMHREQVRRRTGLAA